MATIRGFHLPEDLYYWVEKHVWVRPGLDEGWLLGLTPVAYHLLHHSLEAITVKRGLLGNETVRGKSVALVESVKYIGGVPAPFTGVVVRVNERLMSEPDLAEQDPYGEGWIVVMQPADPAAALAGLVTGAPMLAEYGKLIEAQNIT